jgi:hypothetical protein
MPNKPGQTAIAPVILALIIPCPEVNWFHAEEVPLRCQPDIFNSREFLKGSVRISTQWAKQVDASGDLFAIN